MIEKGDSSWVCGPENTVGLGVCFEPEGDNGNRAYYTARFEARLRQQIPVGANLVIRAWTTEKRKKFAKARAEIRQNSESGPLLAEADAMMFLINRI